LIKVLKGLKVGGGGGGMGDIEGLYPHGVKGPAIEFAGGA